MTPLTREQVREVDRLAIEELGIPGIVLMENAGRNATDIIERYMDEQGRPLKTAVIFCGGGNNGGDGYVIARHLHNHGVQVTILATNPTDQLTGDAAINARIGEKMNLDIQLAARQAVLNHADQTDILIDALLGTGFQGELRADMLDLVNAINEVRHARGPLLPGVAAIDIPSGLSCDTGQPPTTGRGVLQPAVKADLTITFVAPKLGFARPEALPYLGKLQVADIGAPPELVARARG